MSETPARSQGQIEAPNPLEVFWEKNKRWVMAATAVVIVGLISNYVLAYYKQQQVNQRWNAFASATHLDSAYAEDGMWSYLLQNAQNSGSPQQAQQAAQMYLQITRGELTTELQADMKLLDPAKLDSEVAVAKGTTAEPLLLWVKAVRAAHLEDWQAARATLDQLEKGFPDHFLCLSTKYPPQARNVVEEEEPAEEPPAKVDERKKPQLQPPVPGSPVSLLRSQIDREEKFRQTETALYTAPEPDESPEVVIRFAPMDEEIRIRFYKDAAPKHVENFLELVRKGEFYQGQRIDSVQRAGTSGPAQGSPRQLHFGLATSKENDRTLWDEAEGKPSGVILDFEDNDLSHFAGMLAAEPEQGSDGKSSGERIWITANDAVQFDGQRVIFGRVVEGLDVVDGICDRAFVEEEMETTGRGKLQTNVTIDSITIVGEEGK